MAIYPVEFYRRAEEKWKLRYASSRATPAEQPAPKKDGTDDVLTRWPWLGAIGQGFCLSTPSSNVCRNVSWRS